MSTALSIVAQTTGATEEEIHAVLSGMIISAKNQHGSQATGAELTVIIGVCAKYGLNPLVKECAAFISGGKLSVVVMIDGWYKIVNRQPTFDGVEFKDVFDGNGKIMAMQCQMYLKNRSRPVCINEYLDECNDMKSSTWKKWPLRMLRHKAYIQAARMAFGISEVIDDDERNRITGNTPQERDITPQQPKFTVDFDAIEAAFAECADIETLKSAAGMVREELQSNNEWDTAKAHIIAMHTKHKDRIESLTSAEETQFEDVIDQDDNESIDVEFEEIIEE